MTADGPRRERVDGVLVAALAAGATYDVAAKTANVSATTVKRRMREPLFRAEVLEKRDEYVASLRGKLLDIAPTALAVLTDLSTNASSEGVRLRAAATILEQALERRRRIDQIDVGEFQRILVKLIDAAGERIPADEFWPFLQEVRAIAGGG